MRRCLHRFLGRIGYREASALQETTARRLKDGVGGEHLLLLEHDPVVTLGRNAREADLLVGETRLRASGVAVERSDRGGQVTYHGPGQLVGYPILSLDPDRRDVGRYLRDLEEVLIRTLGCFGIAAGRRAGYTGVWAGDGKIASIGVHLSRWVTTHGFALNVTTDLSCFDLIVPCGIRDAGVTSMRRLLGRDLSLGEVAERIVPEFGAVFDREMRADQDAGTGAPDRGDPAAPRAGETGRGPRVGIAG
jgi:lipoyl(octanoyl) transferase